MGYKRIPKLPEGRVEYDPVFAGILPELPGRDESDEAWSPVALAYRNVLERLAPTSEHRCLTGEMDDCGGSNRDHAIAYVGALAGTALAHLGHLNLIDEGLHSMTVVATNRIVDISQQAGCDHVADLATFAEFLALNLRHVRLNTEEQAQQ